MVIPMRGWLIVGPMSYFIGVSVPSSILIYNCCQVGYNYYNYRFFVCRPDAGNEIDRGVGRRYAPHTKNRFREPLRAARTDAPNIN